PGRTAHVMVQEVERGPAAAWALLQVPYAQRAECALQGVALEPVIEQLRNRHRQDAREIDHGLLAEAPDVESERADACQLADIARLDVGRRREVELLQDARERVHARAELGPLGGVGGTDAPDRLRRFRDIAGELERAAGRERDGEPR